MSAVAHARAPTDARLRAAAAELLVRRKARAHLSAFARAVTAPGVPPPLEPGSTEWVLDPGFGLPLHHRVMLDAIQRAMLEDHGRLMIFAPPGSAKSTLASVLGTAWIMGARPGTRVLMTSYASRPIIRHAKRARSVLASREYQGIWNTGNPAETWPDADELGMGSSAATAGLPPELVEGSKAADEFELTNGSGLFAAGILGGITSSRADVVVIDDPVAGRIEAESATIRESTRAAYDDDVMTRLKPRASVILIQTRWAPNDLAGSILPADWAGESGRIRCNDGLDWQVLCIPAEADRDDDPLGRPRGGLLWPEWFGPEHWLPHRRNARTWSSLYQQQPRPETGNLFEPQWFKRYTTLPERVTYYGASDYAFTRESLRNDPDSTEHGVVAVTPEGDLYLVDWWSGRVEMDDAVDAELALRRRYSPAEWVGEKGAAEAAAAVVRRWRGPQVGGDRTPHRLLPSVTDKVARSSIIRALAHSGRLHVPANVDWADALVDQCARWRGRSGEQDDKVDVLSLLGRLLDDLRHRQTRVAPSPPAPGTARYYDALARQAEQADDAARERHYR